MLVSILISHQKWITLKLFWNDSLTKLFRSDMISILVPFIQFAYTSTISYFSLHTSEDSKNNSFRRRIWKKRLSFQENRSVEIKEVKPKHFWNPGHQDSGSHQIPNHLSPKSRKQNLFFHWNITTVWLITQKFDLNIPEETNIIEEVYIFVLILKEKNLKNSKWRIYTKKIIRILYSRYISIIKLILILDLF